MTLLSSTNRRESSIRIGLLAGCSALWILLVTSSVVSAQSAENVAVVINEASPESVRVGEY